MIPVSSSSAAPDAINSPQYATYVLEVGSLEVVGRGRSLRRPAGVAVSHRRADARLAVDLRLVWAGSAALGVLSPGCVEGPRPLRRGFLLAYLCGVLWYMGNCYWVRDTMMHYGDMPPVAPTLLLIGYSMVLGLYFGLFGLGLSLVRKATGSTPRWPSVGTSSAGSDIDAVRATWRSP